MASIHTGIEELSWNRRDDYLERPIAFLFSPEIRQSSIFWLIAKVFMKDIDVIAVNEFDQPDLISILRNRLMDISIHRINIL
jgi:hypothetical protein